jgi:DNA-binding NarL/FixJ family response regulator
MTLRVYIVEDYAPLVERLRERLAEIGADLVGHADSSAEALHDLAALHADVVVTDVFLREGSGLDVLRGLRAMAQPPGQWRIVFTHYCSSYYRDAAARFGATHFFDKQWDVGTLFDTLAARAAPSRDPPSEPADDPPRTPDPRSRGPAGRPDDAAD